jgi:hypothetical protein
MYTEHVGSKRHVFGRQGETKRLYPRKSQRIMAFMIDHPARNRNNRSCLMSSFAIHRQNFRAVAINSSCSLSNEMLAQLRFAFTIRSKWLGISAEDLRNTSRKRRLIRFRTTAPPTLRETVSPKRWCASLFSLPKSTKFSELIFRPAS